MDRFIFKSFVFLLFLMTPFVCLAKPIITNQSPLIDSSRKANFIIDFKTYEDEALPGTEFRLYRVANISDYGIFRSVVPFDIYNFDFDYMEEEDWNQLATEASQYVTKYNIEPNLFGITDENGCLKFENIDLGLYLVIGDVYIEGANSYDPQVFFMSLPNMLEQDVWEYDVEVHTKYDFYQDESKIVNKKVQVEWNDKGYASNRPDSVTVVLYKDGKKYAEVVLNDENDWEYIWEGIDNSYEWTLKDASNLKDYVANVSYDEETGTFIITYTYRMLLPNTGLLWWPVPILFILGSFLFFIGSKTGDKKNEK